MTRNNDGYLSWNQMTIAKFSKDIMIFFQQRQQCFISFISIRFYIDQECNWLVIILINNTIVAEDMIMQWLQIKLGFVLGLYLYHFSLHVIYRQQAVGVFNYSSQQLRIWNEVATIFLVAIVMLVAVKQNMSWVWGLTGMILFVILLMSAIKVYKLLRERR